jgi:hypothetical protein
MRSDIIAEHLSLLQDFASWFFNTHVDAEIVLCADGSGELRLFASTRQIEAIDFGQFDLTSRFFAKAMKKIKGYE